MQLLQIIFLLCSLLCMLFVNISNRLFGYYAVEAIFLLSLGAIYSFYRVSVHMYFEAVVNKLFESYDWFAIQKHCYNGLAVVNKLFGRLVKQWFTMRLV